MIAATAADHPSLGPVAGTVGHSVYTPHHPLPSPGRAGRAPPPKLGPPSEKESLNTEFSDTYWKLESHPSYSSSLRAHHAKLTTNPHQHAQSERWCT
mmetsp:Transcript_47384/g.92430  ORF Transcript_47384/g.92430 Transcript_47384/m.92430 type:complete len:97 (-) Transcript_47384:202-492(-)